MPNIINTLSGAIESAAGAASSVIGALSQAGVIQPRFTPTALPGGAPIGAPLQQAGIGEFAVDLFQGFQGLREGLGFGGGQVANGQICITPRVSGTARFPSTVVGCVPTPSGGSRIVAYRNMGRPMLWSGDLAAVRRVRKAAGKARRRVGGR